MDGSTLCFLQSLPARVLSGARNMGPCTRCPAPPMLPALYLSVPECQGVPRLPSTPPRWPCALASPPFLPRRHPARGRHSVVSSRLSGSGALQMWAEWAAAGLGDCTPSRTPQPCSAPGGEAVGGTGGGQAVAWLRPPRTSPWSPKSSGLPVPHAPPAPALPLLAPGPLHGPSCFCLSQLGLEAWKSFHVPPVPS